MVQAKSAAHGEKWLCDSCGTKFYDLNKRGPNDGAICPECGMELHRPVKVPSKPRKSVSRSVFAKGGAAARPKPADPDETSDEDAEEGEEALLDSDDDADVAEEDEAPESTG